MSEPSPVPAWANWAARFLMAVLIVLLVVFLGAFSHVVEHLFNVGWNLLGG